MCRECRPRQDLPDAFAKGIANLLLFLHYFLHCFRSAFELSPAIYAICQDITLTRAIICSNPCLALPGSLSLLLQLERFGSASMALRARLSRSKFHVNIVRAQREVLLLFVSVCMLEVTFECRLRPNEGHVPLPALSSSF